MLRLSKYFRAGGLVAGAGVVLSTHAACALLPPNSFLDPTRVGRFPLPGQLHETQIRQTLTLRETPPGIAGTTEPTPADLIAPAEEYRIGIGDQVGMLIDDLIYSGQPFQTSQEVTPTGYIRLPLLGLIKVVGMTELELENELKQRLREANLIPDPVVQVLVQVKREQYFLINGEVGAAGPYAISNPDLRLLEAITLARDIGPNAKRIYVIRRTGEPAPAAAPEPTPPSPKDDGLIIPIPTEDGDEPGRGTLFASLEPPQDSAAPPPDREAERRALDEILGPPTTGPAPESGPTPRAFPPVIFEEPAPGRAVEARREPSPPAEGAPARPAPAAPVEERPFDWDEVPQYELTQRVIEIDVEALRSGDPRQNIIVRNRDVITIPIDTGVFYLMGEVNRPGVFGFGGREITLKQAIGAIGAGMTPLGWPQRCEIIRRERGTDKQITIPVDLDRIYYGLEPDVVLRDDDIVNVGTHTLAPFLFVIRNSFRFTYGFGFVYDRNFADKDAYFGKSNPETRRDIQRQTRGLPF